LGLWLHRELHAGGLPIIVMEARHMRVSLYEEDGYRLLLFSTERAICAAAGLAVPHRGR
jgi:hypothetical protein